MSVIKNDFFRQATLRLCGSLEIDKALCTFFDYIRHFVPADEVYLNVYDPESGVVEVIASATPEGRHVNHVPLVLPPDARILSNTNPLPEVVLENHPEDHPIFRHYLPFKGPGPWSMMVVRLIVEGKRLGALSLWAKGEERFTPEHLQLVSTLQQPAAVAFSNSLRYRELMRLKDILTDDNHFLRQQLRRTEGQRIVGAHYGLKHVMQLVRQVAHLSNPVLLLGETGTGKEILANSIHELSGRSQGPFVKVNCGAIPPSLIDSELFGHDKGAFTGALTQKRGRFERADKGTIFLDEIGELPADAQVRLLRVLQDRHIERVGGTTPVHVDIRVIAATHRDLEEMVQQERFRQDLLFRLNVFPIRVPPLRDRVMDIPSLVAHFMDQKSREMALFPMPSLSFGAMDRLLAYHWPGNVRELENVVERALILSQGEPLTFEDLAQCGPQNKRSDPALMKKDFSTLNKMITTHITQALELCKGKVHGPGGAAELLGIHPSTLRARMKKLHILHGKKALRQEDFAESI